MAARKIGKPAPRADVSPFAQAFAESEASGSKHPTFDVGGPYVVKFLGLEQKAPVPGKNDWIIGSFEGDEDVGARAALFCVSSKSLKTSLERLKSLVMAVIGCTDLDEYNQFDPEGVFFSAMLGYENDMSEQAAAYLGSELRVYAARGNDDSNGGHYVNLSFEPAAAE